MSARPCRRRRPCGGWFCLRWGGCWGCMRRKYASRFTEFENLKIIHEHVEIKFKSAQRDLFGRLLPSLSHRSIRLARSMQWNEMKRPSGYLFAGSDFFSISITILSSSSSASNPLPSPSIFFFVALSVVFPMPLTRRIWTTITAYPNLSIILIAEVNSILL